MKKKRNHGKLSSLVLNQAPIHWQKQDYSVLVTIGAVMALALLSGCAAERYGGSSDPYHYNVGTGYPAVGSEPWH